MNTTAASPTPLRIVLPGGSGQVGQALARHFQQQGHHVTVLTRGPYTASWETVHWDGETVGPWTQYLEGADVCINLAGRSVNCRYDAANRKAIYQSRIQSTQLLGQVIAGLAEPPRLWMNASAATIYKRALDVNGIDLPVSEATGELLNHQVNNDTLCPIHAPFFWRMGGRPQHHLIAGSIGGDDISEGQGWVRRKGFSSRVARDWEAAFFAAETPRTRKIALRSAVVLSPTPGSAFGVLSNLVRFGLGGTQGNGRQFVCWIHEADYVRAIEFLIAHGELQGPINIVAPTPLVNREFMAALRWAWDMPNGLPAPALAIKLGALFLSTEPELVLQSCRSVPGRLLDAGFNFEFPEWPEAAEELVRQWKSRD
jgi:NAD dependent epimerase/dehydratase family enzyme